DRHHRHEKGDADDDAEEGEDRSQQVRPDLGERGAEDVGEQHGGKALACDVSYFLCNGPRTKEHIPAEAGWPEKARPRRAPAAGADLASHQPECDGGYASLAA